MARICAHRFLDRRLKGVGAIFLALSPAHMLACIDAVDLFLEIWFVAKFEVLKPLGHEVATAHDTLLQAIFPR
jgi:hypothetical protein